FRERNPRGVTVMPGDLVVGDREGVYFAPAAAGSGGARPRRQNSIHGAWTKRSSTKASTHRAKSMARPAIQNCSRNLKNTRSGGWRKFASGATPSKRR